LTRWQQALETLETVGMALQRQTETLQAQTAQLRRAPWWAVLAGVCLMALMWVVGIWIRAPVVREHRQKRRRGPVSVPEKADPPCMGACGDGPARPIGLLILEVSHGTTFLRARTRERLRLAGA